MQFLALLEASRGHPSKGHWGRRFRSSIKVQGSSGEILKKSEQPLCGSAKRNFAFSVFLCQGCRGACREFLVTFSVRYIFQGCVGCPNRQISSEWRHFTRSVQGLRAAHVCPPPAERCVCVAQKRQSAARVSSLWDKPCPEGGNSQLTLA